MAKNREFCIYYTMKEAENGISAWTKVVQKGRFSRGSRLPEVSSYIFKSRYFYWERFSKIVAFFDRNKW